MKRTLSSLALTLALIPTALAAPLYERPIDLRGLSSPRPVFLLVPESVLEKSAATSLRIREGTTVIPQRTASPKTGELRGIIKALSLCSVEGTKNAGALHDGDTGTSVRPDPLKNPASCTLTIEFLAPVRVLNVTLTSDGSFRALSVAAEGPNGFIQLREVKNATSIQFSSAETTALRLTFTYDTVPTLSEIAIQGVEPARILFEADPAKEYFLLYGDTNPPALPAAPPSLSSTKTTPYVSVGAETVLQRDDDGDGLTAAKDNCPTSRNPRQEDTDRDGIGDVCDNAPEVPNAPQKDQDHDGTGDADDNCPRDFNPDQRDDDIDGTGNVCDDHDGDGVMNSRDNCAGISNRDQTDSDGDSVGDACALDRDSDGVPDAADTCRNIANKTQEDTDRDGIGDLCDLCPSISNRAQEDRNGNGLGDACDGVLLDPDNDDKKTGTDNCPAIANADQSDQDNDGLGDRCDNCPTIQNRDQRDEDKDGQGDMCTDLDSDGLLVPIDNCATVSNADQMDQNNNGVGDACEDDDHDGVINATDNCRHASNGNQGDLDADGQGDPCDTGDDRFSEKHPWLVWTGMSFIVLVLLGLAVRMIMKMKREGGSM